MRKITVCDQVALIALAGESMVCYIGLHNVVQLDVIASLLGLVFNSSFLSFLSFLYYHSFRRVLAGKSYKPEGTKKLIFKRSELYEWLESKGISKEPTPDVEAILASLQKGVRHKPGSIK